MLRRKYNMVKNWAGHQARFGLIESYRFRWRDGINLALIVLVAFVVLNKNIQIEFSLQNADNELKAIVASQEANESEKAKKKGVSNGESARASFVSKTKKKAKKKAWTRGQKKQIVYVKRFVSVAQAEMEKYDIPASITLAQGLLESQHGESQLAKNNNNHFGIKCFARRCKKSHCSNFEDDSHKDFFIKYQSAWESYRAHSKLLSGKRYKHLKAHGKDYKAWAKGLQSTGYATSKQYSKKLIRLIEDLELTQYD